MRANKARIENEGQYEDDNLAEFERVRLYNNYWRISINCELVLFVAMLRLYLDEYIIISIVLVKVLFWGLPQEPFS